MSGYPTVVVKDKFYFPCWEVKEINLILKTEIDTLESWTLLFFLLFMEVPSNR